MWWYLNLINTEFEDNLDELNGDILGRKDIILDLKKGIAYINYLRTNEPDTLTQLTF